MKVRDVLPDSVLNGLPTFAVATFEVWPPLRLIEDPWLAPLRG